MPGGSGANREMVSATAAAAADLGELADAVTSCRACPRLVAWREEVAELKRAAFANEDYWGRPVAGFGDPAARVLLLGLAPAAHGANRTGRVFTGDRSGDFLFAALHRAGFANQPTSVERGDGLALRGAYILALARCAPPANKPTPAEIGNCREYLEREWALLREVKAVLALGKIGMDGFLAMQRAAGRIPKSPALAFGHGAAHDLGDGVRLFTSYHPSQQNTFTGKLTPARFDAVFAAIRRHLDSRGRKKS